MATIFNVPKAKSTNNRFAEITIPQNPWMAMNNWGSPHQDSWCSESLSLNGPTEGRLELIENENPHGYTPNMVCNEQNQMIGVSLDYHESRFWLIVFNDKCEILSSTPLGSYNSRTFGGGYFYLDHDDNTIVVQNNCIVSYPTNNVQTTDILMPNWRSENIVEKITGSPKGNSLYSCLPVWRSKLSNVYWCLLAGEYNYKDYPNSDLSSPAYMAVVKVDPETGITTIIDQKELTNQWNNNTLAVDEDGAYIVTNGLNDKGECNMGYLWAFGSDGTDLKVRWKTPYENAGYLKPGQMNIGSGTTPTLTLTKEGIQLVAITDNADPQMNVVVCNRKNGEIVAKVPCFEKMRSADEASLIGVGNNFVVENNFGHYATYPDSQYVPNEPGMKMISVHPLSKTNPEKIWKLSDVHFYAMNMLCRESGIIFAHTCSWTDDISATEGGMYYISAIDSYNGRVIWRIPLGRGVNYCHEYGGIYFNRTNDLFIGTNKYLISIKNSSNSL